MEWNTFNECVRNCYKIHRSILISIAQKIFDCTEDRNRKPKICSTNAAQHQENETILNVICQSWSRFM